MSHCKRKIILITGQAKPEGGEELKYNSTLYPQHWMEVGGQCHAPRTLSLDKETVTPVQEAGLVLGPVWTGMQNLPPMGF